LNGCFLQKPPLRFRDAATTALMTAGRGSRNGGFQMHKPPRRREHVIDDPQELYRVNLQQRSRQTLSFF
jgi:hypothetical protein